MSVKGGPATVTSGLVLELDAGNIKSYQSGSTTWFDKSGNANNGTLINGPTFNTGSLGSIVFDGVDDYATVPGTTSTNISNYITAEVWIYYKSGNGRIFQKDDWSSGTYTRCWEIGGYSGKFRIELWHQDGNTVGAPYGNSLRVNGWNHLILTFDGTDVKMYQDSVLVNTLNFPGDIRTDINTPLTLGGRWNTNEWLDGRISIARLYNRALSSDEVLQNYNATKGRFGL